MSLAGPVLTMKSVLAEFPGLSVLADLGVTDGKLLAQMQVIGIYNRFVIERAEQDLALLVAAMHRTHIHSPGSPGVSAANSTFT
jgi:hypothetical protein